MVNIPWHLVLKDIERRLRAVDSGLRTATGEKFFRLQGEACALEKIKDLPESLELTTEEKKGDKDGKS